jgi:hypothetical protein
MSRFGKYLGYAKIKVGEDEMNISPTLEEKEELMAVQMKAEGKLSRKDWQDYYRVFKQILKRVDSEATEEELDAFLIRHDMEFMLELFRVFGWNSETKSDTLKKNINQEKAKA